MHRPILFLVLLSGCLADSGQEAPKPVSTEVGGEFLLLLNTSGIGLTSCFLLTPNGEFVEVMPTDNSTDRYEVRKSNALSGCSVTVKNANENDGGVWEIYSESSEGGKASSQRWLVTVIRSESLCTESSLEQELLEDLIWMKKKHIRVEVNSNVTLSISKMDYQDNCTLQPPGGTAMNLKDLVMEGVHPHGGTIIVACEVDIGPINDALLGVWILCGQYVEGNILHKWCQPTTIEYNTLNKPRASWHSERHPKFNHAVHFGGVLNTGVRGSGKLLNCHVVTPFGDDIAVIGDTNYPYFNVTLNPGHPVCDVAIGPIEAKLLGDWEIYATFDSSVLGFMHVCQPLNLFLYDEENPTNQAYNITTLDQVTHVVNIANTIEIEVTGFGTRDNCIIALPSGITLDLNTFSPSTSAVKFVKTENRVCRASIGPISEDMIGIWQISGKFSNQGKYHEYRRPFKIIKEDPANPIEEDRKVTYLKSKRIVTRLGTTHEVIIGKSFAFENCHVRTPANLQFKIMEGFKVPNVKVLEDDSINCGISIYIESEAEVGTWTLISREGFNSNAERRLQFTVDVNEEVGVVPVASTVAEVSKAEVRTRVEKSRPYVTLLCSVAVQSKVTACKFRGPSGRVLLASEGVGEDRYSFHGVGVRFDANVTNHECGLRITVPLAQDLGLWRCAVKTDTDTFYGFLAVLCPWVAPAPGVQREPTLIADKELVTGYEGDAVTMSCTIQSAIKYCYFRAPNGTTYSVSPGTKHPLMEYVGAGFDAGECGIRYKGLTSPVNGHWNSETWSCHVGLLNVSKPEQRATMTLDMIELLTVEQQGGWGQEEVTVTMRVAGTRPLDYCRFVRIDGFGFTVDNVPDLYSVEDLRSIGQCTLRIPDPTMLDVHPWTLAVRIRGQDVEILKSTTFKHGGINTTTPAPTTEPTATTDPTASTEPTPTTSGQHDFITIKIIPVRQTMLFLLLLPILIFSLVFSCFRIFRIFTADRAEQKAILHTTLDTDIYHIKN
ncbi:uncharacterized protein LOC113239386 isoform X2 [Hyposmocoma kahamanoa]|uniref:uncharacterized protein LOC113239386 isoform X2 n=1 Tax=Hyposmocoma kahamanoa TaxID=1477025 RepID=UPI000E6D7428|nr:uncharacterized protein LOC113239386 isoform X2 [Hyposmocoma kahamanoa]